jgi:hypothetical protein
MSGPVGHNGVLFDVDVEWGERHVDKSRTPVKNCHEMVVNRDNLIFMIGDHTRNNVLVYDSDRRLVRTFGTEYPGGHGIEIFEENGQEFLLLVDTGDTARTEKRVRESGRVVKTTLRGEVVFTIGHPLTIGAYEPGWEYRPTEAAVAPNGDIYVADGYGSNYILQYDRLGQFIRKFGGADDLNPEARLRNAHGVCVDLRRADEPLLVCTSRTDNQFQLFTLDSKHRRTVDLPGAFVCRAVSAGSLLYAGVCWSKANGTGERLDDSGFVAILDEDFRVVSNPFGTEPRYDGGVLQPLQQFPGATEDYQVRHGHGVCLDRDGDLYLAQWNAKQVYPSKLKRRH